MNIKISDIIGVLNNMADNFVQLGDVYDEITAEEFAYDLLFSLDDGIKRTIQNNAESLCIEVLQHIEESFLDDDEVEDYLCQEKNQATVIH